MPIILAAFVFDLYKNIDTIDLEPSRSRILRSASVSGASVLLSLANRSIASSSIGRRGGVRNPACAHVAKENQSLGDHR